MIASRIIANVSSIRAIPRSRVKGAVLSLRNTVLALDIGIEEATDCATVEMLHVVISLGLACGCTFSWVKSTAIVK